MNEVDRATNAIMGRLRQKARGASGLFVSFDGSTTGAQLLAEARAEGFAEGRAQGRAEAIAEYGPQPRKRWIYFIQRGQDGPIKIGIAKDVGKRLSDLQVGCPEKLRVLAQFQTSSIRAEYYMHSEFAHLRLGGEWFRADPELVDFARSVRGKRDVRVPDEIGLSEAEEKS